MTELVQRSCCGTTIDCHHLNSCGEYQDPSLDVVLDWLVSRSDTDMADDMADGEGAEGVV